MHSKEKKKYLLKTNNKTKLHFFFWLDYLLCIRCILFILIN